MKLGFIATLAAAAFCAIALRPVAASAACQPEAGTLPHAKTTKPDSAAFPANPTNCSFHQWSWHMFLWLTQNVNSQGQLDPKGEPRFLTFAQPDALYPTHADLPAKGALMPGLMLTKIGPISLFTQAGPDGILVDQQGRIVYYSIYLDDVFKKFVTDNKLNTVDGLRAFNPNGDFPIDALTLKAAWKIVEPGEKLNGYFTTTATVQPLKQVGTKFVIDETKPEEHVTVALVGFHIAGIVAHHAEMIWASFENVKNAPDLPQSIDTIKPDTVVSDKNWTFYKKGTPYKDCNFNPAGSPAQKFDPKTQKMSPVTDVCRLYPFGSGPDKKDNADNIRSINANVKKGPDGLKGVWANYFEVGAIWFITGAPQQNLQPNCTFQPGSQLCGVTLTGSTHLSNATIETFTQAQSVFDNCFACHNTVQRFGPPNTDPLPGKNVDISHILVKLYFYLQEEAAKMK